MSNTSIVPKDAMTFRLSKAAPNTKGILCVFGAGAIFSFTDAVSKMMMDDYPVGEVIFFRSFFVLLVTVAAIRMQGGWRGVRIVDWRRQIARGLNIALTGLCFMFALKQVPLANMTAMVLISTSFTVAAGVALLPLGWVTPDWRGLALFALTGCLQGVAQFLTAHAFIYGEAVVITRFRYFMLLWAKL